MIKQKTESSEINAFLGKNTKFTGTLLFDGMVRIDGEFEGNIKTSDTLVIANTGNVKADIEAGVVKISGKFDGTIVAKNKVELLKPANIKGTINTPSIFIEDGVVFNGQCNMTQENIKVGKEIAK